MENRYKINYDMKQRCVTSAKFKQGDTDASILDITLYDGGTVVDITGETIDFRFKKPDGTFVFQDSTTGVTIANPVQGNVVCVLKANTLASVGVVRCEIHRCKDSKQLTTPTFTFSVEESIENAVLSSNYIASIENTLIGLQNQFTSTFNTNETNRTNTFNTNENTRQSDFNQIKADYNVYKNVMIDSSNVANLQNQINNMRISDNTTNKKYTFQIQVNNGKPQLVYREVM